MQKIITPQLKNLAEDLDEDERKKIATLVVESYEEDLNSRSEWEEKHAMWEKLYSQTDKPKNSPWGGSSSESLPLMTLACNQFTSRTFKAFFSSRVFVKALPVATNIDGQSFEQLVKRAERVGKHLNYQLTVKDRSYKKRKNALFLSTAVHGSAFTKVWYDPLLERNIIENVRAVDLVAPYNVGEQDIENLPRKTHIIHTNIAKTKEYSEIGYFVEPAQAYAETDSSPTTQAVDQAEGLSKEFGNFNDNVMLLEQHLLLDLDEDGLGEPYVATVDFQSKKLLRLAIRYETAPDGTPLDGKRPIEHFTHYQFMPNPNGFYGLGMGHLIGEINTATNKLLRQTIDAGELANVGNMSGFISDTLSVKSGDQMQLKLGQFVPVSGSIDDVKKGIIPMNFPGPNQSLIQLMGILQQQAQLLSSTTEAITGTSEKVVQPTTMMTMVEQGLQLYTSVQEFLGLALEQELEKIYRLNSLHLNEKEYFTIVGYDGPEQVQIGRVDYADDLKIVPVFDPRNTTEQAKFKRAEAEYAFCMNNPLTQQSPEAIYYASRRYLEAIEAKNIDQVLPKPPPPPEPIVEENPHDENALFLMPGGPAPQVESGQDHALHIEVHTALLKDQTFAQFLTPDKMPFIENHLREHAAFLYEEMYGDGQIGGETVGDQSGNGVPMGLPEQALQQSAPMEGMPEFGGPEEVAGESGSAGRVEEVS